MRRLISFVSAFVALTALGLVLFNATTVDRRPPDVKRVSLSASAGDDRVAQTLTAIDIEFTEPVARSSVESRFSIEPKVEGAFSWDGSVAIFTPSHELPAATAFTIRIAAGYQDVAGNRAPVGLDAWEFRTVGAPVVVRSTPADGASGVLLDGKLELVFDRLMDTASVEAAVRVEPSAPVAATWSGSVVTFDFGKGLRFGTTYTVTIEATAADTGGTELGRPFVTHFSTAVAGLDLTTVVPADGVAGISVASPIAIAFDSPIDPVTARGALHVTPSVNGEISVVTLPDDGGPNGAPSAPAAIVFQPSSSLAPNTTYTVTLDPIVARLDDPTIVAAGRTWAFTTGSPTSSGQNQVAFLSSRGGIRNVWIMNPDGTNQRELTVELAPVSNFDVTADGGSVVYSSAGVVSVRSVSGRDLRRLTVDDGRHEYAPAFTPDDAAVILARRDAAGADLGFWAVPLTAAGGPERQVLDHGAPPLGSAAAGDGIDAADGTPVWMPRVAFDSIGQGALLVTADGNAVVLDLGTDPASPITVPLRGSAPPVWVADRAAFVIAATGPNGSSPALYAVTLRGKVAALSGTGGAVGPVALAADGTLAALRVAADGTRSILVVAPSGAVWGLPTSPGGADRWPTFSPDGAGLLFGRTRAGRPDGSDGIWLVDLSSGAARQLATDGAYARWIP
jgi:hypothetical protein